LVGFLIKLGPPFGFGWISSYSGIFFAFWSPL
jgi:hypothetical protein